MRDSRFITIQNGGTLTTEHHRLLALWAADCAAHVLHLFEDEVADDRPRAAIETVRKWAFGEVKMTTSRIAAGHSMGAARELKGAARFAAYAAGQAAAVPHVAAHELGAAAYAIKAVRAAAGKGEPINAGIIERDWQRDHLPAEIRDLVLEDQHLRNAICWYVFEP